MTDAGAARGRPGRGGRQRLRALFRTSTSARRRCCATAASSPGSTSRTPSYPLGICAERCALSRAVAEGVRPGEVEAVAITASPVRRLPPVAGRVRGRPRGLPARRRAAHPPPGRAAAGLVRLVRSGLVAVAGRPNVGKSTLVNALAGEQGGDRLGQAADDPPRRSRPSSTASSAAGRTSSSSSICPGFQRPRDPLTERMQRTVDEALADVDAFLFVLAADERIGGGDRFIAERVFAAGPPVVVALNKVDRLEPARIAEQIAQAAALGDFHALHPVSALTGDGLGAASGRARQPSCPRGRATSRRAREPTFRSRPGSPSSCARRRSQLTREEVPHAISVEVDELDAEAGRVQRPRLGRDRVPEGNPRRQRAEV